MFILAAQRDGGAVAAFDRYRRYVREHRSRFPPGALELAGSDWYFDARDRRCPHDAWLKSIAVVESGDGDRRERRRVSIEVVLLGAYHDGDIVLRYPQVSRYSLSASGMAGGHADWRYDEFRLSDSGIVHEIEWSAASETARWLIEADDVVYEWRKHDGSSG